MTPKTMWSTVCLFSAVVVTLLSAGIFTSATRAQTNLSIRFEEPYYAVSTSNQEVRVFYDNNIIVNNPAAEVACDPPSGELFARGATEVTCTATLGSASATGSFIILVSSSNGTDTDVQLFTISQLPEADIQAGSQFDYNIEVRNNGLRRADEVIVTGTLPDQFTIFRSDIRCDVSDLPTITCRITDLRPGFPIAFVQTLIAKPEARGPVDFTMTVGMANGQADLYADNNTFTITTNIVPPPPILAPENKLYLPLLRR